MLFWESVLELEECFFNVAIHGSLESSVCIVRVKVDVDVYIAFPVGLHGVVVLECFFEMEGIGFVDIFDPEVVNNMSERDGSDFVEVESRGVLGRVVITHGEDFFKLLVSKFAGLFEAADSLANFNVDVTIKSNFVL